jgi:hypothetical protein
MGRADADDPPGCEQAAWWWRSCWPTASSSPTGCWPPPWPGGTGSSSPIQVQTYLLVNPSAAMKSIKITSLGMAKSCLQRIACINLGKT